MYGFSFSFFNKSRVVFLTFWNWLFNSNGFFIIKEGWEYVFVLSVAALAIATLGPGDWSIDHTLGISDNLMGWPRFWSASGLGIGAGLLQLVLFFRPEK